MQLGSPGWQTRSSGPRAFPHLYAIYAIYGALVGFGLLFTWIGVTGFEKRVVT